VLVGSENANTALSVVVENHTSRDSQAALEGGVCEALAEGSITRFLAISR
jgi:hypothetical protein